MGREWPEDRLARERQLNHRAFGGERTRRGVPPSIFMGSHRPMSAAIGIAAVLAHGLRLLDKNVSIECVRRHRDIMAWTLVLIQVTPVPTCCKTEAGHFDSCFTALLVASIVMAFLLSCAKVERRSAVALPVVVRCDADDLALPLRNNARRSPAARRATSRPLSPHVPKPSPLTVT